MLASETENTRDRDVRDQRGGDKLVADDAEVTPQVVLVAQRTLKETRAERRVTGRRTFSHHFLLGFKEREGEVDDDGDARAPLFPLMYREVVYVSTQPHRERNALRVLMEPTFPFRPSPTDLYDRASSVK